MAGTRAEIDLDRRFTSPLVCRLAGVTFRQLDWWVRTGVISPEYQQASGSGTLRLFSAKDVLKVRAIRILRDMGISLGMVRSVGVVGVLDIIAGEIDTIRDLIAS